MAENYKDKNHNQERVASETGTQSYWEDYDWAKEDGKAQEILEKYDSGANYRKEDGLGKYGIG